jgi:hypothetical protein
MDPALVGELIQMTSDMHVVEAENASEPILSTHPDPSERLQHHEARIFDGFMLLLAGHTFTLRRKRSGQNVDLPAIRPMSLTSRRRPNHDDERTISWPITDLRR